MFQASLQIPLRALKNPVQLSQVCLMIISRVRKKLYPRCPLTPLLLKLSL